MRARVLIVDDDPDIIDYLCSFLEDHDYEVASAESASAALSILPDAAPDVILIDVLMPERSGLDLLVTMRKDARWQDLPVVVVTGSDQVLEDECQSYMGSHEGVRGPDGVLGKPIDRDALLAILRQG